MSFQRTSLFVSLLSEKKERKESGRNKGSSLSSPNQMGHDLGHPYLIIQCRNIFTRSMSTIAVGDLVQSQPLEPINFEVYSHGLRTEISAVIGIQLSPLGWTWARLFKASLLLLPDRLGSPSNAPKSRTRFDDPIPIHKDDMNFHTSGYSDLFSAREGLFIIIL